MKRRIKYLCVLLALSLALSVPCSLMEADAAETSASDFQTEGTELVKYKGTSKDVSVPAGIEIIGKKSFENNDTLKSIHMPKSVKIIEAYAFWGCDNLKNVSFGANLKEVGDYSFANCKGLTEITIPDNIRSIGIQAFADCTNLKVIKIPPEVTSIHETSFDGCINLIIDCEEGSYADKYAEDFYKRQAEMPNYNQSAGSTEKDESTESEKKEDEDDGLSLWVPTTPTNQDLLGASQVVGNHAFIIMDNEGNEVVDGDTIEENILKNAGLNFQGLIKEMYPKYTIVNNAVVADQAYYKSSKLSVVDLPEGIREIGQFSFARSSLKKITLPQSLETIGYGAFYGCNDLVSVILPENIHKIEPNAFVGTSYYEKFMNSSKSDFLISGQCLLAYKGDSAKVTIPAGVKVIAAEVFKNHPEIKKVTFPDSLQVIGEGAFENCSALSKITWGNTEVQLHDRAFYNTAIKSVTLPETIKSVGLLVFPVTTVVRYESNSMPSSTHEFSAERLDNAAYRGMNTQADAPKVQVKGVDGVLAILSNGDAVYELTVLKENNYADFQQAFNRLDKDAEKLMAVYDLQLTDETNIPITKLGKQVLTVIIPLEDGLADVELTMVTLDRNGQLEAVPCDRVRLDGRSCIRFTTNYVSSYGILASNTLYDGDEMVLEATVSIAQLAAAPGVDPYDEIVGTVKADGNNRVTADREIHANNQFVYILFVGSLVIAAAAISVKVLKRRK